MTPFPYNEIVLEHFRKELSKDRTKTYLVEISPLGLVEMTRQNVSEGVREILTSTCRDCEGRGVVVSAETHAIEVERAVVELATGLGDDRPDPAFRTVLWDGATGRPVAPNGTMGDRYNEAGKGNWNLDLGDLRPELTLLGEEAVEVEVPQHLHRAVPLGNIFEFDH